MMATSFGSVNGGKWGIQNSSCLKKKTNNTNKQRRMISCSYSSLKDQYRTLQIQPGASESEVKKAFRTLALQYHPDVCKGSNCGVQFHQINEAYDILMNNLREESETSNIYNTYDQSYADDGDDSMRGMYDPDYDLWEEWMGWEGAGIRDYTSHVNPYI
ncbi:Chaperone protein dnaj 8 protein [Thalictrum thalictroides]|uniref:Chaperone protein dnaj 8 protein n=1 Tax=Thalictrum thalictroides TaxID=46969 RepID=A0A7J6UYR2_THATH|nr:Chaperone protein dnaj 8 protein [Thalictrum thalictroides]